MGFSLPLVLFGESSEFDWSFFAGLALDRGFIGHSYCYVIKKRKKNCFTGCS